MQSLDDFFTELENDLLKTGCVENELFKTFRLGDISLTDIKMFTDQYYLYIRTFPQILAGLSARVEDENVRRELAKTVVSELGGEGGEIHFKLFERVVGQLGIKPGWAEDVDYFPESVALVEGIRKLFIEDNIAAALGGHYTIEFSGLPMIVSLYEGFRTFQASTTESMEYFYLHMLVEREHVEWIHNAVEQVADPSARDEIRRGAMLIADLLGDFWAAVQRRLEFQPVPA